MTINNSKLISPGSTIKDIMFDRGIWLEELSKILSITETEAENLLAGTYEIHEEMAAKLSQNFGGSRLFWLKREREYREWLSAKKKEST